MSAVRCRVPLGCSPPPPRLQLYNAKPDPASQPPAALLLLLPLPPHLCPLPGLPLLPLPLPPPLCPLPVLLPLPPSLLLLPLLLLFPLSLLLLLAQLGLPLPPLPPLVQLPSPPAEWCSRHAPAAAAPAAWGTRRRPFLPAAAAAAGWRRSRGTARRWPAGTGREGHPNKQHSSVPPPPLHHHPTPPTPSPQNVPTHRRALLAQQHRERLQAGGVVLAQRVVPRRLARLQRQVPAQQLRDHPVLVHPAQPGRGGSVGAMRCLACTLAAA